MCSTLFQSTWGEHEAICKKGGRDNDRNKQIHTGMVQKERRKRPGGDLSPMAENPAALMWEMIIFGRRHKLTVSGYDAQRDNVSGLFDEVDDVWVWFVGDGAAIDRQDSITHLQLPAAVCRTALDDPAYFMRHGRTCVSCCVCVCVSQFRGRREKKSK